MPNVHTKHKHPYSKAQPTTVGSHWNLPTIGRQTFLHISNRRAIARVKEALHQGWCENPTGLFINSCILWG
ncbi:hypothetical protein ACE1AT_25085 [Pelatocladus sp. BLCC-F211]|uniref:hypothetical protein n=1 Tax=Pelatocladus sp. BLCC-F211 TaxID=3342752 RepID=UPI0035B7FB8F